MQCACGRRHWGRFGAAGLLVQRGDELLLQHRAAWSHEGGTWAVPGGALDVGETPLQGALREAAEEAAVGEQSIRPRHAWAVDHGTWAYTTVVADAVGPITPQRLDAESEELRWVRFGEVTRLPLHSGFAAAWPSVQPLLHRREVVVVDAANVVGSTPDGWWNDRVGAAQRLLDAVSDLAVRGLSTPGAGPRRRASARCGRQDASVAALDSRAGGRGERRRRLAARTGRASARFRRRRGGRGSAAHEHCGEACHGGDRRPGAASARRSPGRPHRRPAHADTAVLSAQALFSRRLFAASTLWRRASMRSTTSASSPSATGGITISRPSTLDATSSSMASRYSSV